MKRISIILTIIALALWSYSILKSKLVIDELGLLHSFPVTYFVAIAIITVASFLLWHAHERHSGLLFLQLFIVIASLLLIPILIGGQSRGGSVWSNGFNEVNYIFQHGHLNTTVLWYHEYPISWVFSAELIEVLGVKYLNFFNSLVPFFWQFVYFPIVYVFLKNTIGHEKHYLVWVGLWLFYLAEWLGFSGLNPQTFGWFFYLVLLALLSIAWRQRLQTISHQLITILASIGLVLSHWLSSVFGFAGLTFLLIRKKISLGRVLLLAIGIIGWTIYGATMFFQSNTSEFIGHVFKLDEVWQFGLVARITSPNLAHVFLDKARSWYTLAFLGIGSIGMLIGLTSKKDRDKDIPISLIAVGIIGAVLVIAFSYRQEIIDKTYLFGIPIIAYFGIKLFKYRITATILCLLILFMPVTYMLGHYGNALVDHTSSANIEGLDFFNNKGASYGSITGNYNNWGYVTYSEGQLTYYQYPPDGYNLLNLFLKNPDLYKGVLYEQLKFESNTLVPNNEIEDYPHYVAISLRDEGYYYWVWNRLDFLKGIDKSLNSATNCNLVYANPDMTLYVAEKGP